MSPTPDARRVYHLGSIPAHLRIALPAPGTDGYTEADNARRNLASLGAVFKRLSASSQLRTAPNHQQPLCAAGSTALALLSNASSFPSHEPPTARARVIRALAQPPEVLVAHLDLVQLAPILADLATRWLDSRLSERVIIATPGVEASASIPPAEARVMGSEERREIRELILGARFLATVATTHNIWIQVLLDGTNPGDRPHCTQFPVLTPRGLELAALARFGRSAIHAERDPQQHVAITARTISQLLTCNPTANLIADRSSHRAARARDAAIFADPRAELLINRFFAHAAVPDVVEAAATRIGTTAAKVELAVAQLRNHYCGHPFRVIQDR